MAVLLLTVVLTATATVVTGHLRYVSHQENTFRAQSAAQSAVNTAIARLANDQEYAKDILWGDPSEDEEWTVLTFAKGSKDGSTNNTRSATSVEGSRGAVLANTVHLVAVSHARSATYTAESTVYFPPYPYALASSGKVVSEGKLEVLGVDSISDAEGGLTAEEKKPGHIVSNGTEANYAVVLSSDANVEGEVRAVGGINPNGAKVLGGVKPGQQPADLPEIRVEDYDPRRFSDNYNLELSTGDVMGRSEAFTVSGQRIRVNANGTAVTVNNGVVLDDGLLYVEGDLHVRGGVKGTGAVVATGKITIEGPSAIDGEMTALVSGKGVVIDGHGLGVSSFRGLVATLGDFEADSTSVLGAYLAVGKDPVTQLGTSTMTLKDVQAIHAPEATKVEIVVHKLLKEMLDGGKGNDLRDAEIGLLANGVFYTFTGAPKKTGESSAAYKARKEAEIRASYEALKGPTNGDPHPLAAGRVIVYKRGAEVAESDLERLLSVTRLRLANDWTSYLESLSKKSAELVPIFSIDLNRFTSGSSRLRVLIYR